MMTTRNNYGAIDHFRIIAAILVIAIHTRPLSTYTVYGDFLLTGILARLAVPFFFMASGFFLFRKSSESSGPSWKMVHGYAYRIGLLYLLSILIYLPVNLYAGYFKAFGWLGLVKDVLFDGTLYHLWYFPALFLGIYLTVYLYKKVPFPLLLAITGLLYMIGLLGDSYFGITIMSPTLHAIYSQMFTIFDYTRNGLFFSPIFLALGASLGIRPGSLHSVRVSAVCFAVFLGLMLAEGVLLEHHAWPRHDSMYIFLVPAAYYLFQWLISLLGKSNRDLRQISTWMYIVHPLIIVLVRGVGKVTDLRWLLLSNSVSHFVSVTLLSALVAIVIARIGARRDKRNRKNKKESCSI
ncbi:Surface polysaccharide O-acyltransferase, integral membrane enzyme [Paenibacillus sophorae]|nr:acyltransferase [Paenibacillus sophorae]SEP11935.1 Surface polysaccharide O-acyltransferase, integral membrane enzyme [Paenibacillus sophorae]